MFDFKCDELVAAELKSLAPGDLFLSGVGDGSILRMYLDSRDTSHVAWMDLSGPDAFQMGHAKSAFERYVLKLPRRADSLNVRFKECVDGRLSLKPGVMMFESDAKASIAAHWRGSEPSELLGVSLADFKFNRLGQTRFQVLDWQLGYQTEHAYWIKVAERVEV